MVDGEPVKREERGQKRHLRLFAYLRRRQNQGHVFLPGKRPERLFFLLHHPWIEAKQRFRLLHCVLLVPRDREDEGPAFQRSRAENVAGGRRGVPLPVCGILPPCPFFPAGKRIVACDGEVEGILLLAVAPVLAPVRPLGEAHDDAPFLFRNSVMPPPFTAVERLFDVKKELHLAGPAQSADERRASGRHERGLAGVASPPPYHAKIVHYFCHFFSTFSINMFYNFEHFFA